MERMQTGRQNILKYEELYDKMFFGKSDSIVEKELIGWFSAHRYLDRENFLKLGMWKSPRPKRFYEANSEESIIGITGSAIESSEEFYKVCSLQNLKGVSWPVASVILHFAHPDKYMIMDFRAIESLGMKKPSSYNFDFWMEFTNNVRGLSKQLGVSLRTLDKALWMYSKLNQK